MGEFHEHTGGYTAHCLEDIYQERLDLQCIIFFKGFDYNIYHLIHIHHLAGFRLYYPIALQVGVHSGVDHFKHLHTGVLQLQS